MVNLVHQIEKVLFNLLIIIIVQLLIASLHVNTNYSLHFTKMNKYIWGSQKLKSKAYRAAKQHATLFKLLDNECKVLLDISRHICTRTFTELLDIGGSTQRTWSIIIVAVYISSFTLLACPLAVLWLDKIYSTIILSLFTTHPVIML